MPTESQFPKAPPLRFELTEEQTAMIEEAKPPGDAALPPFCSPVDERKFARIFKDASNLRAE